MNGGMTEASRTFLMTSTAMGALYQVRRWEAGSWIVLKKGGKMQDILVNKSKMWETQKRYPVKKERKKISYRGV